MIYEAFSGSDLRTCKRIISKMLEHGGTIEGFFEFVNYVIGEEKTRRELELSTNLKIKLQVDKTKLTSDDIMSSVGWKSLRVWLKLCSLFAQYDLTIRDIKTFISKARKLELENTEFGKRGKG